MFEHLLKIGFAGNFEKIFFLLYINSIEHGKENLSFDENQKFVLNGIKKDIFNTGGCSSSGKIINLAFEENVNTFNEAIIQTRFMNACSET